MSTISFHQSPSCGSRVVLRGQTDMTMLRIAFCNCVKAREKDTMPIQAIRQYFSVCELHLLTYLRAYRPACPSSLFHTWETLLQEVEIDSQAHSDIASILGRQVSRPLLERSFHRKIQSRKVFTHRESYETILTKTEDKLAKVSTVPKNCCYARSYRFPVISSDATYHR
jgi:uncharacterized protein (UPF0332 family)